jgi:hypothetical protein
MSKGEVMSSAAIVTVIKMLESLPDTVQQQVVEHLRAYVEDLRDELEWDSVFARTQLQLIAAAQRAKQEIAEGRATPLDDQQL